MVRVPNLTYTEALKFSHVMKDYYLTEGEDFDFSAVKTCDPFPMLLASTAIRQIRKRCPVSECHAANVAGNGYARHMRFYTAIGINYGKDLDENYGGDTYLPITRLDVASLREDGAKNFERIQEVIERKASQMAGVLARGEASFKKWIAYVLTEMIRNIPEHSKADSIWYCMQYWPSYDLVELSILDEGIGIKNSLLSNPAYNDLAINDYEANRLALKPGISRTFAPGKQNMNSDDEWKNSGYGLYMVSQLCDRLGGSFLIASGDNAILLRDKQYKSYDCYLEGTAIQIRIKPSQLAGYSDVAKDILREGEKLAGDIGFSSASKSSKSILRHE